MKFTENIEKESVSNKINKFFNTLDYNNAEFTDNKNKIHISFADTIEIKKYPFPTEEDKEIFKIIGISDIFYHMVKDNKKFIKFEFDIDKNMINKIWN